MEHIEHAEFMTKFSGETINVEVLCYGNLEDAKFITISWEEDFGPLHPTQHTQKIRMPKRATSWTDVLRHVVEVLSFDPDYLLDLTASPTREY